jgi:hypothetical protein
LLGRQGGNEVDRGSEWERPGEFTMVCMRACVTTFTKDEHKNRYRGKLNLEIEPCTLAQKDIFLLVFKHFCLGVMPNAFCNHDLTFSIPFVLSTLQHTERRLDRIISRFELIAQTTAPGSTSLFPTACPLGFRISKALYEKTTTGPISSGIPGVQAR